MNVNSHCSRNFLPENICLTKVTVQKKNQTDNDVVIIRYKSTTPESLGKRTLR